MTIEQCYKDKELIIQRSMDLAFKSIQKEIEKDNNYTLADDELTELVYELMILYYNTK